MNVETDGVRFAPGGHVIPVSDKPAALFGREVSTYRDLPGPLAAAVGKALADRCFITMGYQHGPSAPLLAVIINPGFGTNSKNTYMYVSERQPGALSTELATHVKVGLRDAGIQIHTLDALFQTSECPRNEPDFARFQKEAVHHAAKAMARTVAILHSILLSTRRDSTKGGTTSMGLLFSGSAGASCLSDKWTCNGDEALTFSGNTPRLHHLFYALLKGWLGGVEASIHWAEGAQILGVSALELEITTAPFPYQSFFGHEGHPLVYADVDGGWKCALRDTVIDAQGCVEFAPSETPPRLRIWLPLTLPDSF